MAELRVSALLLAAGWSGETRTAKQRLRGQRTAIRQRLDSIMAAGIRDTVVVLNREAAGCSKDFRGLPVRFAVETSDGSELTESVRAGLRCLGDSPTGVLLCRMDQPPASAATMRKLALDHYSFCGKVIIPVYQGQPGHPALFPRQIIIETLSGLSLQDVIRKDSRRLRMISLPDEAALFDRDIREDYEKMTKRIMA